MSETAAVPTVLITGANGFIGARLAALCLDSGYRVVAGVRKSANLDLLKELPVEYRYGDITETSALPDMVRGVNFVIHNAGLVKAKSRSAFFVVNAVGTANLMATIAQANPGVRKVILISSLAAAGPSQPGSPLTEDQAPHPVTVYGESKLAGEREALKLADRINIAILRPSGVYGPGDKEMITFFRSASRGIRPYFGATERRLQLVHVDDLCRSVLCALKAQTRSGSIYFVAERQSYTLSELVELVCRAVGRRGFPLVVPGFLFRALAAVSEMSFKMVGATPMLTREKANELLATWEISTDKARRELGFESRIQFADGSRQTYEWYRQHGWM